MRLLFISILTFLSFSSIAQQSFQGKAIYMSKSTMDMNFGNRQLSEEQKKQIAQRMKSFLEKKYILTFDKTRSLYKEEEKLSAPNAGGGRFSGMMSSFSGGIVYKDAKDSVLLEEKEFFGKKFLISDNGKALQWKLGSETKTIGNYTCFKATCTVEISEIDPSSFRRRPRGENSEKEDTDEKKEAKPKFNEVVAWYTPQIPVSQGPGEFWGLPGLIIEVSSGRTTVLCTEIVLNPDEKIEIEQPKKGKKVTREEYKKIAQKKVEEMREQFRSRRGGNRGGFH